MLTTTAPTRKPPRSKSTKTQAAKRNVPVSQAGHSQTTPPRQSHEAVELVENSDLLAAPGLRVWVGPFAYELVLYDGLIPFGKKTAWGVCDATDMKIIISNQAAPERRLSVFWHEMAHAWCHELTGDLYSHMEAEEVARMVGLAMAKIGSRSIALVERFLNGELMEGGAQ